MARREQMVVDMAVLLGEGESVPILTSCPA
jgi:hypothetical protein